jgi:splicing factor 3A subunit 2
MTDRQNREGGKTGGGGLLSGSQQNADRKERLRRLALETIDLNKDPYFMRNHLGKYECKLCMSLHLNEGSYLAHTQGKKHKVNLLKRAQLDANAAAKAGGTAPGGSTGAGGKPAGGGVFKHVIRIGLPAYKVTKLLDTNIKSGALLSSSSSSSMEVTSTQQQTAGQRGLFFEVHYPHAEEGLQPRHRFMSAFEQKVEKVVVESSNGNAAAGGGGNAWQYLVLACDPYENIAFKIPNAPIDKTPGKLLSQYDKVTGQFSLRFYYAA